MKKSFMFLVMIIFLAVSSAHGVEWRGDDSAAGAASEKEGKPLMRMFYSAKCAMCEAMEKDVFSDSQVSSVLKKFVCVRIDINENPQLAAVNYNVHAVPAFIFYDRDGKVTEKFAGLKDKKEFLNILHQALAQH